MLKIRKEVEIYGEEASRLKRFLDSTTLEIPAYNEALSRIQKLQENRDKTIEKTVKTLTELTTDGSLQKERDGLVALFRAHGWGVPDAISKESPPLLESALAKVPLNFEDLAERIAELKQLACVESRLARFQEVNAANEAKWSKNQERLNRGE